MASVLQWEIVGKCSYSLAINDASLRVQMSAYNYYDIKIPPIIKGWNKGGTKGIIVDDIL